MFPQPFQTIAAQIMDGLRAGDQAATEAAIAKWREESEKIFPGIWEETEDDYE